MANGSWYWYWCIWGPWWISIQSLVHAGGSVRLNPEPRRERDFPTSQRHVVRQRGYSNKVPHMIWEITHDEVMQFWRPTHRYRFDDSKCPVRRRGNMLVDPIVHYIMRQMYIASKEQPQLPSFKDLFELFAHESRQMCAQPVTPNNVLQERLQLKATCTPKLPFWRHPL